MASPKAPRTRVWVAKKSPSAPMLGQPHPPVDKDLKTLRAAAAATYAVMLILLALRLSVLRLGLE